MSEPLEDLRPWRKGTESDWRNWRKQAVNVALVGVALLILGPLLLVVGGAQIGGTGNFLTMVGIIAVMAGIVYYVSYTRKLERLPEGGGQR